VPATGAGGARLVRVTAPREILPERLYMITRRCTQRQFLLTPCPRTNHIVKYALAYAALVTGVRLHAVCFMSNHWHGVVSDPGACLPKFLEHFHRLIAKAQNAWLNRRENFWSSERTSVVHLETDADVLAKMAYVIANPTAAMLVERPEDWPGLVADWSFGSVDVSMPDVFFDRSGTLPKNVVLEIVRPKIFEHRTGEQLGLTLREAVERLTKRVRESAMCDGSSFVGAAAVLEQSFDAKPSTAEPLGALDPKIAAKAPAVRVRAIKQLQAFLAAYRAAWLRWRDGLRDVVFPAGTYALRLHAGVACAPV